RSTSLSGGARAAAQSNERDEPDDRHRDDPQSFACDVRSIRHVAPPGRRGHYSSEHTALISVYSSSASCPISRPPPDCLYPPNGSAASKMLYVLIQTV